MLNLEQFKRHFVDDKLTKNKGNFKDGKWVETRCRIDPSFFVDFIYEYIFTNKSTNLLTEQYLELTRNIQKKKREYKNSHGMDGNAIINWFKIKRIKNKSEIQYYEYDDIKNVLTEYCNEVINQNSYSKIFKKWNSINYSPKNNNYKEVIKTLEQYTINDSNSRLVEKIDKEFKVSNNFSLVKSNNDVEQDYLKRIGNKGEEFAYQFLCDKYGKENVNWISKKYKYYPYDIEVTINNKQTLYYEIKSSTDVIMKKIYISRNEYNFYNQNKANYNLFLISNINPKNDELDHVTNYVIYEKPNIIVDLEKYGFKGDTIYITPETYYTGFN